MTATNSEIHWSHTYDSNSYEGSKRSWINFLF